MMTTQELCANLIARMVEIDPKDRAPEGNDYNLLWDAILDEMRAAIPTIDLSALPDA